MNGYITRGVLSPDLKTFGCVVAVVRGIALVMPCDGRGPAESFNLGALEEAMARAMDYEEIIR